MHPQIATIVLALGILALFLLDRDQKSQVSPALWIPVAWVSLGASRMVSFWLGVAPTLESPDQYLEGSPLDRLILAGLMAAGLIVLFVRGRLTGTFLRENGALLIFFLYALLSVLWSEYPDVTFKRWTKAVGNLVMVLVVLTDFNPSAAVKRLLARVAFLLIPLSVLFIKYYPELGRSYHWWTWGTMYNGVATTKNGLGVICLVFGLGSLWRVLEAFHDGERPRAAGSLIAHGAVLAMVLWLFWKADSVTSLICFLIGGGLIAFMIRHGPARRQTVVHLLTVTLVFLTLCVLFLGIGTGLLDAIGRDATLAGRTELWAQVLQAKVNPWVGVGFESFWLGERAEYFWELYYWRPNQAHNGYLEIFLTLGWIGVVLLSFAMAWGYRNVVGSLRQDPELGRLRMAYFVVALVYNLTEAAFKVMHPVWFAFLLAITVVSKPPRQEDGGSPVTKAVPRRSLRREHGPFRIPATSDHPYPKDE